MSECGLCPVLAHPRCFAVSATDLRLPGMRQGAGLQLIVVAARGQRMPVVDASMAQGAHGMLRRAGEDAR